MVNRIGANTVAAWSASASVTSLPSGHQEKQAIEKMNMHVPVNIDVGKQKKT